MSQAADPFDLAEEAFRGTAGGRRPGAGRPVGAKDRPGIKRPPGTGRKPNWAKDVDSLFDAKGEPQPDPDSTAVATKYAQARADKEFAAARRAELKLKIEAGEYLPREDIKVAMAKAYQTVAQAVRTIPDILERRFNLEPTLTASIGEAIEDSLGGLQHDMQEVMAANAAMEGDDDDDGT